MRFDPRSLLALPILVAPLALVAGAAAQTVSGGDHGVKGRLVSRTVTAPASAAVPIYTTEPKGSFVLTQLCWGDASAGDEALLSGSALGLVATDRQTCRAYEPGLAFGPSETLTCENGGQGFPLVCTITGVQTGK